MGRGIRLGRAGLAILCLTSVVIGVSGTAASAAAGKAPIVIGFITDETGGASSSYIDAQDGAIARIDAQNAAGGVDGRKLQLVVEDDQSTASGNLTAAKDLVEDKAAFGIIDDSSFTFGAASYLNENKIPVTGAAIDGPEWGQQPNSNMFSVSGTTTTPIDGKTYGYNSTEEFLKQKGVTKLAQVVYNISSAITAANGVYAAAKPLGISNCLESIIPFGDVSFTTFALQMKSLKCNGVEVLGLLTSCIAIANALKQAGVKVVDYCITGYDQNVLNQPSALASMQGTYSTATINVLGNDLNAPTKLFLSRLKKFTSWPGGIPSLNIDYGYESADLMIQGLQLAGSNPTRQRFISKLRTISSYTAGGLIPAPGEKYTDFGTLAGLPKTQCAPLFQVKGHTYVPTKSICGKLVVASSG
jgi:branched-chain amino acid transport system substrate-binding protein